MMHKSKLDACKIWIELYFLYEAHGFLGEWEFCVTQDNMGWERCQCSYLTQYITCCIKLQIHSFFNGKTTLTDICTSLDFVICTVTSVTTWYNELQCMNLTASSLGLVHVEWRVRIKFAFYFFVKIPTLL